jgi:hypothetical protein
LIELRCASVNNFRDCPSQYSEKLKLYNCKEREREREREEKEKEKGKKEREKE